MPDARSNIETSLAVRVAEACRVLGLLDLTLATLGHASARIPDSDDILIRARGPAESGVRYTSEADIIVIDADGKRVGGTNDGYQPPLEAPIHTEILRRRPDVNAVVHIHPRSPVLLSICDVAPEPIYGAYDPHSLGLVLAGIPVFERSVLVRTRELGAMLADCLGSAQVVLMRGHGITTAANSVEEAALLAIHLDTLATITTHARLLGGAKSIPQDEQDEFRALQADTSYGAPKPGIPSGRAATLWRYYSRLAAERA